MRKKSQRGAIPQSRGSRKKAQPDQDRGARTWLWGIAGVALIAVLAIGLMLANRGGDIEGITNFGEQPRSHSPGTLTYAQTPPVGGVHNDAWLNCGIYDQPIPNENAVHSLEHGAVWITYEPGLAKEEVEQLRSLARGRRFVLLSPYEGLPTPVVASAWGLQLQVESANDPRLQQFIVKYQQGPQTPEPGAPCTNGIGTPVER